MTIAQQADVEAALLRALTAEEATFLGRLLARADAVVAEELPGVKFDGILTSQTATLPGSDTFEVWLPGRPVRAVASVTLDMTALTTRDYRWTKFGDVARISGSKVWPVESTIVIVYEYGMLAAPQSIVSVAADLVKYSILNPSDVKQESVGQYATTYADPSQGLTDDHRRVLDRYRYPVAF